MSASYVNPWHSSLRDGEPVFKTDAKPTEHRGFLIYQRIPGAFEVVKDGVCLTQRAGLSGAKWAIDNLLDNPTDWEAQRMAGYLELAAAYAEFPAIGTAMKTEIDAAAARVNAALRAVQA